MLVTAPPGNLQCIGSGVLEHLNTDFGVHSIERFIIGNVTDIWWTFMILDSDITKNFTGITRIFIMIVINEFYC